MPLADNASIALRPEEPLGSLAVHPASQWQNHPHVASNGDGYLVVWNDVRNTNHTFASLVDANGRALQPSGFDLGSGVYADVVWAGDAYVVALTTGCSEIQLLRVSLTGEVTPITAGILSSTELCVRDVALAVANDRVIVVWVQDGARYTVVGLHDRMILGTGGVVYPLATAGVDVASNGTDFMIATLGLSQQTATPETIHVSADGALLGRRPYLAALQGSRGISIAWNGSAYTVVWTGNGLAAQLVAADNSTSSPRLQLLGPENLTSAPELAAYSGGTLLTYSIDEVGGLTKEKVIARIDAAGNLAESDRFPLGVSFGNPFPAPAASNGRSFLVTWYDMEDVYAAVLDTPASRRRDPHVLVTSTASQYLPRLASDGGSEVFAVWGEELPWDLRGEIVRRDGTRIMVDSIVPSDAQFLDYALAFDGTNFAIVWQTTEQVLMVRVSRDGVVLDRQPIVIAQRRFPVDDNVRVAVAAGAGRLLVVSLDSIEAARVIAGTIVTDGVPGRGFALSGPIPRSYMSLAATWDGSQFYVAWALEPQSNTLISPRPPEPVQLRGARVTLDGSVLDPGGIEIAPRRLYRGAASVVSNGRETLVIWTEGEGTGGAERSAWAARVGRDGSVTTIGSFLSLGASPYYPVNPRAVYDGSSYVLFWVGGAPSGLREGEYVLQRYSPEMQPLGPPEIVGTSGLGLKIGFDVVSMRTNEVAVGYERLATEPLFGSVPRVFVRMPMAQDGRRRATSAR